MENHMAKVAEQFVNVIKTIAEKPENLDNLECYLSHHFEAWVKKIRKHAGRIDRRNGGICEHGNLTI